jgi:outer membrane protein assembly factor BamB
MKFLKSGSFLILFPIFIFFSCTRSFQQPDKPATPDNSNGTLYINIVGNFMKMDVPGDSVYWVSNVLDLPNSVGNPMTFDSGCFYHGNYSGMACYNTTTGLPLWTFSWLAFSDAIPYIEPAFNSSQVFVSSPTSEWDHGHLYCLNKTNGAVSWQVPIDSGYVDTSFNGVPLLYGNNVIILTRGHTDQKYLSAFSIQDGSRQWSVPVSYNMTPKLWLDAGRIYSAYGPEAFCFDAATGQLLWETDLNTPNTWWTYNYLDADKIVVVKVKDNSNYGILQIRKDNGSVVKSGNLVIPTTYAQYTQRIAPMGCSYKNNTIYIAGFYSVDSLDIYSYDISSLSQQWKVRLSNNLITGEAPLLTDKYLLVPVNEHYATPGSNRSDMIFLDLSGKQVKKIPYNTTYTDVFCYQENAVLYQQPFRF